MSGSGQSMRNCADRNRNCRPTMKPSQTAFTAINRCRLMWLLQRKRLTRLPILSRPKSGRIEIFSRKIYDGDIFRVCFASAKLHPRPGGNRRPGDCPLSAPADRLAAPSAAAIRCMTKTLPLPALDPQCVWMHPEDAKARGLADGMTVRVYNDRGGNPVAGEDYRPDCERSGGDLTGGLVCARPERPGPGRFNQRPDLQPSRPRSPMAIPSIRFWWKLRERQMLVCNCGGLILGGGKSAQNGWYR